MRPVSSRLPAGCLAALGLLLLAAGPARAKKPLNPHWGKKRPAYQTSSSSNTAVSSATASLPAGPPIPRLPPGRWNPQVKQALEAFIAAHGKASRGFDPEHLPAAALAFNDVAVVNDVGLAVFSRMVDRADFKFGDPFWQQVPLAFGRQRLRAAYSIFLEQPASTWLRQPSYQQYRKGFYLAYADMCARLGELECRSWLAKLVVGFGEAELSAYTRAALGAEYLRPLGQELVADSPEDRAPVRVRHGLAWVPELRALIALLRDSGFDVWLVDANEQHEFEVAAAQADFDPSRVLGIRAKVVAEKLSAGILPPVPVRGGKPGVLAAQLERAPLLVVGSTPGDRELLQYAAPGALRLLLDRGDAGLLGLAAEQEWLVQPAFSAPPGR